MAACTDHTECVFIFSLLEYSPNCLHLGAIRVVHPCAVRFMVVQSGLRRRIGKEYVSLTLMTCQFIYAVCDGCIWVFWIFSSYFWCFSDVYDNRWAQLMFPLLISGSWVLFFIFLSDSAYGGVCMMVCCYVCVGGVDVCFVLICGDIGGWFMG